MKTPIKTDEILLEALHEFDKIRNMRMDAREKTGIAIEKAIQLTQSKIINDFRFNFKKTSLSFDFTKVKS
jgi:hypothetical protein